VIDQNALLYIHSLFLQHPFYFVTVDWPKVGGETVAHFRSFGGVASFITTDEQL